jgi:hypothetical protein
MRAFGDFLVFSSRMALLLCVAMTVCAYAMPVTLG